MRIGVDYYPEHWDETRWATDLRLMQEAGFNVVRLAEFDWVHMEPEEGRYCFEMWDRVLALIAQHGISAILCTPTAVMPAWAAQRYPECLALNSNGARIVWGIRKNNCFSVPAYHRLSRGITEAMARHFAGNPAVIGWQTDNEFGHPWCYCDSCRASFHAWLREKYGRLEELNRAWGTHFWGHRYSAWEQIPLPVDIEGANPSACLDWQRHFSYLNVAFQREQVEILRRHCPDHFVTHNLMGLFPELNYYDLGEDLDFVSWDNYPVNNWSAPNPDEPYPAPRYTASLAADLMRGIKRKNFWVMEQTAGPGGWGAFGRNPRPGEIRSIAYQQLAHGADGQVWFRWRTCTAGREQYWHGLLGHDGVAGRRYEEAKQTCAEYRRLEGLLEGTTVKSRVALLWDYDSLWAVRIQPSYARHVYADVFALYYNALFRAGVNVDLISPMADFSGYKLVLAPDLFVLPDELAQRLDSYVHAGGVLFTDCRSGVKDATGLCHERTLPGRLSDALGVRIPEYESLAMPARARGTAPGIEGAYTACDTCDWIVPESARALAGYEDWHLQRYTALTRNEYGSGKGWYLGCRIKEDVFYDRLIALLLRDAGIEPAVAPPPGVEISVREKEGLRLLFCINHTEEEKSVRLPAGCRDLLAGRPAGATVTLGRHGVGVFSF